VQRYSASLSHQVGSLDKKRRVVAKVEWHPGEFYPRVGFIVTNLRRSAERVMVFYNHRGTAEQHIKEGKNAFKWMWLSCRKFRNDEARLQLHALAYNLANFMRVLALPEEAIRWPPCFVQICRGGGALALSSETSWNGSTDCDDRTRQQLERGKYEKTEGEVCLDYAKAAEF